MKTRNFVLTMAAAGLLFSMPACKKNEAKPEADNPVKAVAEAIENTAKAVVEPVVLPADYKKEDVNSLLTFVPADSPMVIASTREINLDHPFYNKALSMLGVVVDEINTSLDFIIKKAQEDAKAKGKDTDKGMEKLKPYMDFVKEISGLAKDYRANAASFGLNPNYSDNITYLDDGLLVSKQTVDDGEKLKAKLNDIIKLFDPQNEYKIAEDVEAGGFTWTVYSMNFNNNQKAAGSDSDNSLAEDMKKQRDEALARGDKEAADRYDESIKMLESLEKGSANNVEDMINDMGYSIHFGKNVITIIFTADKSQLESYARILKPAEKPLDKSAFGTITSDMTSVGFIDNVNGIDKLLSGDTRKFIEELIEEKIPEVCDKELKEIVADYPRIIMTTRITDDHTMVSEGTLVAKDKETLKKIQSLHTPVLPVITNKSLIAYGMNFDIGKALNLSVEMADALSKKTYQCEYLAMVAGAAKEIPALTTDPQFAAVKGMIAGFSGINIAIDKLNIKDLNNPTNMELEGIVNVTGSSLGAVAPLIMATLVQQIPQLAGLQVGGNPVAIDLTPMAKIPLQTNAILTNTDFLLATKDYDIKAIAAKERKPTQDFFVFNMNLELYAPLLKIAFEEGLKKGARVDEKPEMTAIYEGLKPSIDKIFDVLHINFIWSFGTNDEGYVGKTVIEI